MGWLTVELTKAEALVKLLSDRELAFLAIRRDRQLARDEPRHDGLDARGVVRAEEDAETRRRGWRSDVLCELVEEPLRTAVVGRIRFGLGLPDGRRRRLEECLPPARGFLRVVRSTDQLDTERVAVAAGVFQRVAEVVRVSEQARPSSAWPL